MDKFSLPKISMSDLRQITSDATTIFSRAKQVLTNHFYSTLIYTYSKNFLK